MRVKPNPRDSDRLVYRSLLAILLTALALVAIATNASAIDPSRTRVVLSIPETIDDVPREMSLEKGHSTFLQTEYDISRVSVGDADIVDVEVLGSREVQLLAKKVGQTNVVVWSPRNSPKAAISITVDPPHAHVEAQLRQLLSAPDIKVEGAGESLVLRGSVPNALAVEQAMTIANAYSKEVINLLEVGGEHQVMLEVVVAEMSRTIGRRLGSNFAIQTDGGSVQVLSLLSNLTTLEQGLLTAQTFLLSDNVNLVGKIATGSVFFDIFLDLLEEKGLGKVLAEPTLVARSGESASFLAGGEIPILIPQGTANNAISLEYKDFGVGLIFEPIVLGDDRISLNVSTEVSELNPALGISIQGLVVPAFTTRRASTTIELADGHSFAIAGLLKEDVSQIVNQYPWLGELPIIGAAFRSSQFQRSETELVVLVTPRLAKPIAPGPRPTLPTDHYIEPSAWEFYVFGTLEGRFWDRSDIDEDASSNVQTAHRSAGTGGLMGGSGLRVRGEILDETPATSRISTDDDPEIAVNRTQEETSQW